MFARLGDFLVRHSVLVLLTELLITAAAAIMASRIEFDFAPESMLRGSAELRQSFDDFKRTFAYEDSVLIVVLQAPHDKGRDVLTREALNWQIGVAQAVQRLHGVDRIDSIATMQTVVRGMRLPPRVYATPVLDELIDDSDDLTELRVRKLVAQSPLMEGSLLSRDHKVTALMCFLSPEVESLDATRGVITEVRKVLDQIPPPAGYRVHLTGLPFIRVDTIDGLQADQHRLLPFAALLYMAMLTLVFRRVSGSIVPLVAIGFGLSWTIGGLVMIGETFNLISNILPILLLVIGVSNCVHIISDYGEATPKHKGNRRDAMREVISHMGYACLLSMLTTAIGFASLFNARSDVLVDFGWQCAWGMACLYVTIICTLGSGLQYFRPPRAVLKGAPLGGIVTRAADTVDRHPKLTLCLATIVLGSMVWTARGVRVNASMIETYEAGHPTLVALHLVDRELGGLLPLEVDLRASDPAKLLEPETYRRVKQLEQFARDQDGVLFARSYLDLHDAIGGSLPGRGDEEDATALLKNDDQSIRDRLERSQWLLERVGDALSYPSFMTADGLRARLLIKSEDIGTRRLHQVIKQVQAEIQTLFPPGCGVTASLTGEGYVNTVAMENVIRDLFSSLLTASVVIFSTIGIGFRSLRAGLIAAIPNTTPLLFTLGYMGLRGFEMNVSNVIVFTISLGIAVDDTIHFLARFRELVKVHKDVALAVHHTYAETGRAIVIVTLLVVSGLSVLLFSDFMPTRRFAELTIVTMATAVFGDLLLLPACLVLFWHQQPPQPESTAAAEAVKQGTEQT
ncbi:MAG: efflux RND transporter permease subunit [Planctomycetaceae bacterium]